MIFLKKKQKNKQTWKYGIFFKHSEKMIFPKNMALEYDLSCCIIWKDDISFSRNMFSFFRRKMEDNLSQKKYMET